MTTPRNKQTDAIDKKDVEKTSQNQDISNTYRDRDKMGRFVSVNPVNIDKQTVKDKAFLFQETKPQARQSTSSTTDHPDNFDKKKRNGVTMTMNDWQSVSNEAVKRKANLRTPAACKTRWAFIKTTEKFKTAKVLNANAQKADRGRMDGEKQDAIDMVVESEPGEDHTVDHKSIEISGLVGNSSLSALEMIAGWTPLQDRQLVRLIFEDKPRRKRHSALKRSNMIQLTQQEIINELEKSPYVDSVQDQVEQPHSHRLRSSGNKSSYGTTFEPLSWNEIAASLSPTCSNFEHKVRSLIESSHQIKSAIDCQQRWLTISNHPDLKQGVHSNSTFLSKSSHSRMQRLHVLSDSKYKVRPSVRRSIAAVEQAFKRKQGLSDIEMEEIATLQKLPNDREQTSYISIRNLTPSSTALLPTPSSTFFAPFY
ncbi:hypothetical protein OIO90_003636 [Microbotryomycetes sp. JL221]|nr:hypothetical protein OIO90_003636 [Microbotryomycetes sp. JL221]